MTKSVAVVITASDSIAATVLVHLPLMKGLNAAWTGLHWNSRERMWAIVKATITPPTAQSIA